MAVQDSNPADLSQKLPPLIPRRRKASATQQANESLLVTPKLATPLQTTPAQFKLPTRRILSPKDLDSFHSSSTYTLILAFVFGISDSVPGKRTSDIAPGPNHVTVKSVLSIIDDLGELLKAHPPLDTGSRFGNPIFRSYINDVKLHLDKWHQRLNIPTEAIPEVSTYLENSFGSSSRLDYGSGHELNFFLWLLCLNRLSQLPEETFPTIALVIFPRYLTLIRRIQMAYYLEPAGSHGVWGLDDYQFLPFLLGAAQLVRHPFITPKGIHSEATIEEYSKDYLYLNQIAFVNSTKTVKGLRWHSPMLDDISGAKNWEKVEAGMKKMFIKDVLGKLPVMQHFLFGSLIPAVDGMSEEDQGEHIGHDHEHSHGVNSWGDCCGIKVPSSLGAAAEMKKRLGGEGLRRIPFD
jgi:serine/threonine-protein phosphatase 2A activator